MKTISIQSRIAILFTVLFSLGSACGADTPLQLHMKTLAGGLKTVQSSLKAIAASPGASHDSDWAAAKTAATTMAQAAGEARTLFPPNVAGNAQAEAAFSAALGDLQSTIQDQLIKALDLRELGDAQAAVQAILDKRADGHDTFIPHH